MSEGRFSPAGAGRPGDDRGAEAEGRDSEEPGKVVQPRVGGGQPAPFGPQAGGGQTGPSRDLPPEGLDERDDDTATGVRAGEGPSLEAVVAQRDEYLDALRRLQADFENYKKRVLKQQTEHLERAAEALVEKLLPVLDALDLAVAHAGDSPEGKVVAPIATALADVLEKEGLERIDPQGQPFDPNQHDAVMHEEGSEEPEVSEVLRAGYRWKGRVLRPAMVKVKG